MALTVTPAWGLTEQLWDSMRPLLERLLAAPWAPRASGIIPAVPGIYLFSEGGRYRYVGQTRNLRTRLGQHTRPSGTHFSATLAFFMAKQSASSGGIDTARSRPTLQGDPDFVTHFTAAKAQVASWDVQYVEVHDPDVRTVFEVFVHVALGTDLNTFETH